MKFPPIFIALVLACASVPSLQAEIVPLASNGSPVKTIAVPTTASAELQNTASELSRFLTRMAGGTFIVAAYDPSVGPGTHTIVLGRGSDLNIPSISPPSTDLKMREHHLIGTTSTGSRLVLAGSTDTAVSNAVFDFLEKLGCRWFFPGTTWEITPYDSQLAWSTPAQLRAESVMMGQQPVILKVYTDEVPDYKKRHIWHPYYNRIGSFTGSEWVSNTRDYNDWSIRNRNNFRPDDIRLTGLDIKTTHNYLKIVNWAKANNRWSDDYHSLIGGQRNTTDGSQLCIGTPEVQQIARDYAVAFFQNNPNADSISMEPNDTSLWCECQHCQDIQDYQATGFVTDRVVTLANAVAEVIPEGRYVGILAYNKHLAPPSIIPASNVYVTVTTGYFTRGWNMESLMDGWSAVTGNLGIYDYFSVYIYDHNLPNIADASNLQYLKTVLPEWHNQGADVFETQSTHAAGPLGFGHYLACKLLWNTEADADAILDDFLEKSFGLAAETMREFYELTDKGNGHLPSPDLIGRLYRILDEAMGQTPDNFVKTRLRELALWLKYCDWQRAMDGATTEETKQPFFEQTLRHAYRMRATNMVDSLSAWRILEWQYDALVSWPLGAGGVELDYRVPPGTHPWKDPTPYTAQEIDALIQEGIANNPLVPEPSKTFSEIVEPSRLPPATRGTFTSNVDKIGLWVYSDSNGQLPSIQLTTGLSSNKGDADWTLFAPNSETPVGSGTVPPDQVPHPLDLPVVHSDTGYFLLIDDHGGRSQLSWAPGAPVSFRADRKFPLNQNGGATYRYFYVPEGTEYVIAYAFSISKTTFHNAAGDLLLAQPKVDGGGIDIVIPVPEGSDGQAWRIGSQGNSFFGKQFHFRNVPGPLAARPDELLIPLDARQLPPDQIPGLAAWYDASDPTMLITQNNAVETWADKSGSGRDLTQPSMSKRPLVITDTQTGLPVIGFDGVDDILGRAGTGLNQPLTVFLVFRRNSTGGADRFFGGGHAGTSSIYFRYASSANTMRTQSENGGFLSFPFAASDLSLMTAVLDGNQSAVLRNGQTVISGGTGAAGLDSIYVGGRGSSENEWMNGDFAEILVYQRALDETERQSVESYLGDKWGIPVPPQ